MVWLVVLNDIQKSADAIFVSHDLQTRTPHDPSDQIRGQYRYTAQMQTALHINTTIADQQKCRCTQSSEHFSFGDIQIHTTQTQFWLKVTASGTG